jgi:hypothetical protein
MKKNVWVVEWYDGDEWQPINAWFTRSEARIDKKANEKFYYDSQFRVRKYVPEQGD